MIEDDDKTSGLMKARQCNDDVDDFPPNCFVARLSFPCQSVSHKNQPKYFKIFFKIKNSPNNLPHNNCYGQGS